MPLDSEQAQPLAAFGSEEPRGAELGAQPPGHPQAAAARADPRSPEGVARAAALLVPGARCKAVFYAERRLYPAKVACSPPLCSCSLLNSAPAHPQTCLQAPPSPSCSEAAVCGSVHE
eukprot:3254482-Rhodomonas_salina.1